MTPTALEDRLGQMRARRSRPRRLAIWGLLAALIAGFVFSLMSGQSFTPLPDVVDVLLGRESGSSFTVGVLRLPRAATSIVCGMCFGLAGAAFQVMLRNTLASPDIIGISFGASAAAVVAIVFFSLSGAAVSGIAVVASLAVALLIYLLSFRDGVSSTRLILVGIGIAALLEGVISYALNTAVDWNLQEAMRWLSGSVNGATWTRLQPVLYALPLAGGVLLALSRNLEIMRMGDDTATALGVNVPRTRIAVLIAASVLIAFATAAAGPVSFVAFLAGPLAIQMTGRHGSPLLPAALTGALLVLVADYAGQFLLPGRYPVGVVTGVLGAPYLIYCIIRANRLGGTG